MISFFLILRLYNVEERKKWLKKGEKIKLKMFIRRGDVE